MNKTVSEVNGTDETGLGSKEQDEVPSQEKPRSKSCKKNPDRLTANEMMFVKEYLSNGRNGQQAYLKVFPTVKITTAGANAARMLAKARVYNEIQERIDAMGLDRTWVMRNLALASQMAREQDDPNALATASMDVAKLLGLIVDRQEVKDVTEKEREIIRGAVVEALQSSAN